jgi:hypothetical protein
MITQTITSIVAHDINIEKSGNKRYCVDADIRNCPEFYKLMKDGIFCSELWTAFANVTWYKAYDSDLTDSDNIVLALTDNIESRSWGSSFRGMGGVIADLRNDAFGTTEDYMHWYCSNVNNDSDEVWHDYGYVSDRIRAAMQLIGWKPVEDSYYLSANQNKPK